MTPGTASTEYAFNIHLLSMTMAEVLFQKLFQLDFRPSEEIHSSTSESVIALAYPQKLDSKPLFSN